RYHRPIAIDHNHYNPTSDADVDFAKVFIPNPLVIYEYRLGNKETLSSSSFPIPDDPSSAVSLLSTQLQSRGCIHTHQSLVNLLACRYENLLSNISASEEEVSVTIKVPVAKDEWRHWIQVITAST